jgi:CMP-N-acetylneuraminic acid synthetase
VEGHKLLTEDLDSVVCITEMGDPIQLSVGLDEKSNQIDPNIILNPSPLITGNTRSQDFQKYYRANGGFYMSWTKSFLENQNFFKGKVKGHVMDQRKMVDIDYESDFKLAEFLYNNVLNK